MDSCIRDHAGISQVHAVLNSVEIAVLKPVTALATILLLETHPLSVGKYPNLYSRFTKSHIGGK